MKHKKFSYNSLKYEQNTRLPANTLKPIQYTCILRTCCFYCLQLWVSLKKFKSNCHLRSTRTRRLVAILQLYRRSTLVWMMFIANRIRLFICNERTRLWMLELNKQHCHWLTFPAAILIVCHCGWDVAHTPSPTMLTTKR